MDIDCCAKNFCILLPPRSVDINYAWIEWRTISNEKISFQSWQNRKVEKSTGFNKWPFFKHRRGKNLVELNRGFYHSEQMVPIGVSIFWWVDAVAMATPIYTHRLKISIHKTLSQIKTLKWWRRNTLLWSSTGQWIILDRSNLKIIGNK